MPEPAPYWNKKPDLKQIKADLAWNFPEQKSGTVKILGGTAGAFSAEVKLTEFLNQNFGFLSEIRNIFPDVLKSKLPPLPTLDFYLSTDSGSFADSPEFRRCLDGADFGIILGDLSKNSVTAVAVAELIKTTPDVPILLTRDAVDLVAGEAAEFIDRKNLTIVASLASLQKLLRALYYPRPLLISQPILPVIETLHKFTLSYACSLFTFHDGKIICASGGKVATVDLAETPYTPLGLWNGEIAGKIAVYNIFNKNKKLDCMLASVL